MHYYQHHIGDFIRDTANLTDGQCVAYLRLIWRYYDTERPLEDDPEALAFAIGSDDQTVGRILRHYFKLDGGEWRHSRIDEEIARFKANSEAARKRAESRWKNAPAKPQQCASNATALPQHDYSAQIDANQQPITNNQQYKNKGAELRFDPLAIELPACISLPAWSAWVQYRRQRKLTLAEPTMRKQVAMLEQWFHAGHDPQTIIEASIANGWQGLFEPKLAGGGRGRQAALEERNRMATEAWLSQEGGDYVPE